MQLLVREIDEAMYGQNGRTRTATADATDPFAVQIAELKCSLTDAAQTLELCRTRMLAAADCCAHLLGEESETTADDKRCLAAQEVLDALFKLAREIGQELQCVLDERQRMAQQIVTSRPTEKSARQWR